MTDYDAVLAEMPESDSRDPIEVCGLAVLSVGADLLDVAAALRKLAALLNSHDTLDRRVQRDRAVQVLKAAHISDAAGLVDAALGGTRNGTAQPGQGQVVTLSDPEPWPDPVDGAEVLGALAHTFKRFGALPKGAATAFALWTVHAHALDAAFCSPLLVLTSPERRCGKSTMMKVLGALVARPLPAASISPAALFRGVEKFRPTLLLDEADTAFRESEELRAIVNAAHDQAGAVALRTVGDTHEPRTFSTWCPKAIALIGTLPGTLTDRAIVVPMRRRKREEPIERLRLDRLGKLEPLRRQAWRWARDHLHALKAADPQVPAELHDRAADNWRPLLAIADAAGGLWPERAREAAQVLSGRDEADDAPAIQLLGDLFALFEERGDRLFTVDILAEVIKREDRPWSEWRQGKPLTARQLARLVGRFGVPTNQTIRIGERHGKGYKREDFIDAFARYLPPPIGDIGDIPAKTGGNPELAIGDMVPSVTDAKSRESSGKTGHVTDVTDREGGSGQERPFLDPDEAARAAMREGA